jgi:hypothetical protein
MTPELPRATPNLIPIPPIGPTVRIRSGDVPGLQAALDAARGHKIELEAGGIWDSNFTLPGESYGSLATAAPPEDDVRLVDTVGLPKLIARSTEPVIRTLGATFGWQFVGVEIASPGALTTLVLIDEPGAFLFDRVYVHGSATKKCRRAFALNGGATAIVNSVVTEVHEEGADSQAICGWGGAGPFAVINCLLEGAGENIMFGGADPSTADLVPSDITILRNTIRKPMHWCHFDPTFAGIRWSVKNLLELKNARRVLIEGNVMENCWRSGQDGYGLVLTTRNQEGTAPWSTVEDVTFKNNHVRNVAGGIQMLGRDDSQASQQGSRWLVFNNLFTGINTRLGEGYNGRFLLVQVTSEVEIAANTIDHDGNLITVDGPPNAGFKFEANLSRHNDYGVMGDSSSPGLATLHRYFPSAAFTRNVLSGGLARLYPAGNEFPADFPPFDPDFRQTIYPGVGCDIDAMHAAMNNPATPPAIVETAKQRALRLIDEARRAVEML